MPMRTSSLIPEKPLRLACNRCHAQKLRCTRSGDADKNGPDEPCSRCRKAGAPCIVGKRGKVGRPAKRKANPPTPTDAVDAKTPSPGANSLIHAFGVAADAGLQQQQQQQQQQQSARASTPETGVHIHPLLRDSEDMMLDAGSPVMKHMHHSSNATTAVASETSHDGDVIDADTAAWSSHHAWPSRQFSADPTGFPGSEGILYEPFPHDIGMYPDLPTFHFPPDSTEMFDLLSDLSTRILLSSEKYRSAAAVSTSPEGLTSRGDQIVRDTVDFAGELIDTARQSLPRFFSVPGSASQSSASSETDMSTADDDDDDDDPIDSAAASVNDWISERPPPPAPCIPDSAVIFLLLGCYTQLLYLFEVAIDCLYYEHRSAPSSSDMAKQQGLSTVNSLLKASLSIHTVTYLLGRVHRAFAACELGDTGVDSVHSDEAHAADTESWHKSLLGRTAAGAREKGWAAKTDD
ncbi:hypothetical protein G7046_g1529 [Stylonectria norvegica]|nr:hypothetical protein G7046_g1529 [Stylonectria norvegica]